MELLQFYRKLPDDKIKTYKNMYRITVNICSEETETSFQGTYYFDSKSKVYIQDEKMLNQMETLMLNIIMENIHILLFLV